MVRVPKDGVLVLAEVERQTDPDELIGPDGRPRDGYGVRFLEGDASGLGGSLSPEEMEPV
jgi:hypothetical protein